MKHLSDLSLNLRILEGLKTMILKFQLYHQLQDRMGFFLM